MSQNTLDTKLDNILEKHIDKMMESFHKINIKYLNKRQKKEFLHVIKNTEKELWPFTITSNLPNDITHKIYSHTLSEIVTNRLPVFLSPYQTGRRAHIEIDPESIHLWSFFSHLLNIPKKENKRYLSSPLELIDGYVQICLDKNYNDSFIYISYNYYQYQIAITIPIYEPPTIDIEFDESILFYTKGAYDVETSYTVASTINYKTHMPKIEDSIYFLYEIRNVNSIYYKTIISDIYLSDLDQKSKKEMVHMFKKYSQTISDIMKNYVETEYVTENKKDPNILKIIKQKVKEISIKNI